MNIPSTLTLENVKIEAKAYQKKMQTSYMVALNKISEQYGFKDYRLLKSYLDKNTDMHSLKHYQKAHKIIVEHAFLNKKAYMNTFSIREAKLISCLTLLMQKKGVAIATNLFTSEENEDDASCLEAICEDINKLITSEKISNIFIKPTDRGETEYIAQIENNEIIIFETMPFKKFKELMQTPSVSKEKVIANILEYEGVEKKKSEKGGVVSIDVKKFLGSIEERYS